MTRSFSVVRYGSKVVGFQERIAPFIEAALAPVPIIGEMALFGANVVLPAQKRAFDALQRYGEKLKKSKR